MKPFVNLTEESKSYLNFLPGGSEIYETAREEFSAEPVEDNFAELVALYGDAPHPRIYAEIFQLEYNSPKFWELIESSWESEDETFVEFKTRILSEETAN